MKKKELEKILKLSAKAKIELIFNDVAPTYLDELEAKQIYTTKDYQTIQKSLSLKELKQYEETRRLFFVLIFFITRYKVFLNKLLAVHYKIQTQYMEFRAYSETTTAINKIINNCVKESEKKEAIEIGFNSIKDVGGELINNNELIINKKYYTSFIKDDIDRVLSLIPILKQHLLMFEHILKKDIKIKSYSVWVKKQEEKIENIINSLSYSSTGTIEAPEWFNIPKYKDIKVEITKQDIETFKNTQL